VPEKIRVKNVGKKQETENRIIMRSQSIRTPSRTDPRKYTFTATKTEIQQHYKYKINTTKKKIYKVYQIPPIPQKKKRTIKARYYVATCGGHVSATNRLHIKYKFLCEQLHKIFTNTNQRNGNYPLDA
jgi:hypothetical protein